MSATEAITWTLGTLLSLATLVGIATKFVLLPYIRAHVVDPLRETRHQVTVNHHSSTEPTVLDRIDDVANKVDALGETVTELSNRDASNEANMTALTLVLDEHLRWSRQWVANHGGE